MMHILVVPLTKAERRFRRSPTVTTITHVERTSKVVDRWMGYLFRFSFTVGSDEKEGGREKNEQNRDWLDLLRASL